MFQPMYIGSVNDRARLACMGVAFAGDNHLIFINVQGASTHIEQFDAELRSKSTYVGVQPRETFRLRRQSGYASRSENSGYLTKKVAIPNSTDLSMIAVHSSVSADTVDDEHDFSYLLYENEDDLKVRLWTRVHSIVNIPVARTPEVMDYLLKRGQLENSGSYGIALVKLARTAAEAAVDTQNRDWTAWGIHAATVSNKRERWEQLISKAIRDKAIAL